MNRLIRLTVLTLLTATTGALATSDTSILLDSYAAIVNGKVITVGEVLSAENKKQLWIPAGFAHAFLVLSEVAEFLYKTTDYYAPALERCIRWDDPTLAIAWPLSDAPSLSAKDQNGMNWGEI